MSPADADICAVTMQLYMGLASEGYEMSYRRIPLSRERTPEAADLDTLHSQMLDQPPGGGVCRILDLAILCCVNCGANH